MPDPSPRKRFTMPREVRIILSVGLLVFVFEWLVVHQFASARQNLHLLTSLNPFVVALAVIFEIAAIYSYVELTRTVLYPYSPGRFNTLRVNLAGLAISHVVPGGTAPAGALSYRIFNELGVPKEVQDSALAYLVVVLEQEREERLEEDTEQVAGLLAEMGAIDVYVLPPAAGAALIQARERAFWTAKAAGADDILDVVVPRAEIPGFMEEVAALASQSSSWVAGCGHAGDGNVHLSVFQPDHATRSEVITAILRAGMARGGAISGEHGIGLGKRSYLAALEDPVKISLWRRIKAAFDPNGVLNPGTIFEMENT